LWQHLVWVEVLSNSQVGIRRERERDRETGEERRGEERERGS